MRTTDNAEIPDGVKKEELLYLHDIISYIEQYNILSKLVMSLNQTPLKYIPISNHTLTKKGSKAVSIAGSFDKRSITGTFTITLSGEFTAGKVNKVYQDTNFLKFFIESKPKVFQQYRRIN